MQFNEYQQAAAKYDLFTDQTGVLTNPAFIAKILGLSGETGEVSEKFKKIYRDHAGEIDAPAKAEIAKELGDVLWYLASIARYLDLPLSDIAESNLAKLESRFTRNQLHGSGDNR